MSFINAEVQALITKAVKEGGDAAKLAATVKDLEGKLTAVEAKNAEQEADLAAIAKAVQDGALTAEETTTAVGEVLEVDPVNAPTAYA
jgi:seryl-tRNA synthetase